MTSNIPRRGRHRTDALSLIFGLLFLVAAGSWAAANYLDLPWSLDWSLPHLGWIVAGALVLAGLLGVLASLRREQPIQTPPLESPPAPAETDRIDAPEGERPE